MTLLYLRTRPMVGLTRRGAWAGTRRVPTAGHRRRRLCAVPGLARAVRARRRAAWCLQSPAPSRAAGYACAARHGARSGRGRARQAERWALVGNAVSVSVARWLGARLAQPHRHKYFLGAKDRRMLHETRAAHGALSSAPCKCGGCRLLGACRAASCLPSATSTAAVCLHKVVLLGHGIGGAAGLRGCRVCASTVLSQWVRLQRRTVHATPNSSDRASTAHAERCSSLAAVQQRLALLRRSPASPRVAKRRRWRTASSMTSTVWTAVNINRVGSAQRAQPPRAGAPSLLAPTVAFCVRAWLACAARQRVTIGL